jgi:uncharacterized protein (DUF58 family)
LRIPIFNAKNSDFWRDVTLVNEYEAAISYPLVIFLNLDPYEYGLRQRELYFERTIEAAASLCLMASRERQELGIMLYNPHEGFTFIKPGAPSP